MTDKNQTAQRGRNNGIAGQENLASQPEKEKNIKNNDNTSTKKQLETIQNTRC
jgi:hypothetical protein